MKHRIWTEKNCLVTRIPHLSEDDDNYARDILEEQYNNGWCGITKEGVVVVDICLAVGLKNACEVYVVSREEVREAMMYDHLRILKKEMEALKKLDRSKEDMQDYMTQKSLEDACLEFRWRTGMIDCRAWMPGKYGGLKACPHCSEGRDAGEEESGVLTCTAYTRFRQGLDPEGVFKDRMKFLRMVHLVRLELEK